MKKLNVRTCNSGEDGGSSCAVNVVRDGFETALDVQLVADRVSADQNKLSSSVESIRHVIKRIEMRISEYSG